MPPHRHARRTEIYLYFDLEPDAVVFHFMGRPGETRHLVVRNLQVVLSPVWSMHFAAATSRYAFVWSDGGREPGVRGHAGRPAGRAVKTTRRAGALVAAAGLLALVLPALLARGAEAPPAGEPWARLPEILSRIVAPEFPARDFVVTKFGAKGDGKKDASAAFRKAIEACNRAGGGRVVVPPGTFVTGPIRLKSRREPPPREGGRRPLPHRPGALPPARPDALGRDRADGLLAARLRARRGVDRGDGRGDARRRRERDGLVALEGEGAGEPEGRPRPPLPDGRGGRPRRRAASSAEGNRLRPPVHRAVPLPERPDRGRHDHERPVLGDPPGPLAERHRAEREGRLARPEQRRLRPRVVLRRPDRGLALRHRGRLHRAQVGAQRRRPAARDPGRAGRRAALRR